LRFNIFVQVMMVFLTLGVSSPEATCSDNFPQVMQSGCCGGGMVCKCHHDLLGTHSCDCARAPLSDKSTPDPKTSAPSLRIFVPLFTVNLIGSINLVSQPAFHLCERNVSPAFCGHSPQSVLRVWLI